MHQIKTKMKKKILKKVKALKYVSTTNYKQSIKQAGKSRASFNLLSSVNPDIPLVSRNLKVRETIYTNLLRRLPLSLSMTR